MDRALGFGVAAYVAGFWFFPDGFWHLMWFLVAVVFPACDNLGRGVWASLRSDRVFLGFAAWAALAASWSVVGGEIDAPWWRVVCGFGNIAALVVFVAVCRALAPDWSERWAAGFVVAGAIVVVISFTLFYGGGGSGAPFPAGRFRDVLVFTGGGGLHPVLTGLLCAWGGVLAVALSVRANSPINGWLAAEAIIVSGCLYSHSRGAILALAAGLVALAATSRPSRLVAPAIVAALVALIYFSGVPAPGTGPSGEKPPPPGRELIARGDNGRVVLYRFLWSEIDGPAEHLLGRGLWSDRSAGPPEVYWEAPHPHSAYFGTYLAGGVIGLGAIGGSLFAGLLRGWKTARRSRDGLWLSALVCGSVGLVFDGDSLVALWTVPRVEPLLFWLPWAVLGPGPERSPD